ncbi:ribonuclease J [Candidatus Lariskella endosymbiont of Epinotia ramella]|uniref:ribonuclease J n=1 Tax=Candidatus Lariskella endosymbiont of Epinotia ramella TaxID=3066224 RepID=UPI0030CC520A
MSLDFKKYYNDLLFLPLGGAGEIGMNLNLYYHKGKWLMVDLGIGFADGNFPGVDVVVPNVSFISKYAEDVVGLVLTHAHEDHIGGVQYFWTDFKCPIYTTKFTSEVLKAKMLEAGLGHDVVIHEMLSNKKVDIGPFNVEMIHITHSIPEMNGLMIRTDKGNIFHTGDWKLDRDPLIGQATDEVKLKSLGDEGVLAMVGDSTNIFNHGWSGSEGALQESLHEIISGFENKMIVITTFASNIARLSAIATAAAESGRRIILAGRSLWRLYRAAIASGYLKDLPEFLPDSQISQFKRHEVLIICTGCQGELLAATNKIVDETHPNIKLHEGDVIIFSSKIIPGNEKKIYALFNKFCRKGIEVLTERDHFVHVSGHPARDEVSRMYDLIRPQIAIPVHGEAIHIHEHAKLARSKGCKHAVEIANGDVFQINSPNPIKIGVVESGYTLVDGYCLIDSDSTIIRKRRSMRDHGLVVANLLYSKNVMVKKPRINAPGVLEYSTDSELLDMISKELNSALKSSGRLPDKAIEKTTVSIVRSILKQQIGKRPEIVVNIIRV